MGDLGYAKSFKDLAVYQKANADRVREELAEYIVSSE